MRICINTLPLRKITIRYSDSDTDDSSGQRKDNYLSDTSSVYY